MRLDKSFVRLAVSLKVFRECRRALGIVGEYAGDLNDVEREIGAGCFLMGRRTEKAFIAIDW
ncbi:MAG TPA: hypothetical protein PK156_01405 [Polyangium sp.]|nr:hypothetical protein [Polyangium sp.]